MSSRILISSSTRKLTVYQVLPLVEESEMSQDDDLFSMDDIKLEVMRARGAGGQVRSLTSTIDFTAADVLNSTSTKRSQLLD